MSLALQCLVSRSISLMAKMPALCVSFGVAFWIQLAIAAETRQDTAEIIFFGNFSVRAPNGSIDGRDGDEGTRKQDVARIKRLRNELPCEKKK